jgi:transcriptional regulator with XRE-family HTH domain
MSVGTIPNRLREARDLLGYTQSKIEADTGVLQSTLSDIEHGKRGPSYDIARRLSRYYGVSIEDLFPETNSEAVAS